MRKDSKDEPCSMSSISFDADRIACDVTIQTIIIEEILGPNVRGLLRR